MSTSQNQPTSQATSDLRRRLERSLEVNGQPADRATINRIVSSSRRSQPTTSSRSTLATSRPFSLLR